MFTFRNVEKWIFILFMFWKIDADFKINLDF